MDNSLEAALTSIFGIENDPDAEFLDGDVDGNSLNIIEESMSLIELQLTTEAQLSFMTLSIESDNFSMEGNLLKDIGNFIKKVVKKILDGIRGFFRWIKNAFLWIFGKGEWRQNSKTIAETDKETVSEAAAKLGKNIDPEKEVADPAKADEVVGIIATSKAEIGKVLKKIQSKLPKFSGFVKSKGKTEKPDLSTDCTELETVIETQVSGEIKKKNIFGKAKDVFSTLKKSYTQSRIDNKREERNKRASQLLSSGENEKIITSVLKLMDELEYDIAKMDPSDKETSQFVIREVNYMLKVMSKATGANIQLGRTIIDCEKLQNQSDAEMVKIIKSINN